MRFSTSKPVIFVAALSSQAFGCVSFVATFSGGDGSAFIRLMDNDSQKCVGGGKHNRNGPGGVQMTCDAGYEALFAWDGAEGDGFVDYHTPWFSGSFDTQIKKLGADYAGDWIYWADVYGC